MLPFMKMISRDKRIKHFLVLSWEMGVFLFSHSLSFKLFLLLHTLLYSSWHCCSCCFPRSSPFVPHHLTQRMLLLKAFCPVISHCLQMRCDTIQYFSITTCQFQFHFQHFPITFVSLYLFGISKYIFRFHPENICVPNLTMEEETN